MIVVLSGEEDRTKLNKRQKEKIAILKLTKEGEYVENVGIRDGKYILITEDHLDEEYLAHFVRDKTYSSPLNKDELIKAVLRMMVEQNIDRQKDILERSVYGSNS